jgi:hypothetical protein
MAKSLQRLAMAVMVIGGVMAIAAGPARASRPERPATRVARARGFQLFAGANKLSLEVNRFYCGLTDAGNVCTDVTGSPVLGGGSWPRGTPDQYVFNTGIQVAGVIPSNAGFAWAGDTVGAWGIDTRGPAEHMQALTGIYNSLNTDDVANWPSAAVIRDTSLYDSTLVGRSSISQQDTWMRYWDGAPSLVTGRRHTMGLLVEQRSLAWNFPTGNEDLIYFVFRFTNVTARGSSGVYDGLSSLGYSSTDIDDVKAIGDAFQTQSEAAFNVAIPDGGYTFNNVYVGFTADMDVGDATNNYASADLPFTLATTWKADWREASWQFPSDIFAAPLSTSPGFVGVKLLASPAGLSIFTTYTNPSAPNSLFPDPLNIYQGYRYISGNPSAATGDASSCQYPPSFHLCFLGQAPSDQRQMQSSGPFNLAPGESKVIVVAYMAAPAALTNPGDPTYTLAPYIGNTTLTPGVVPQPDTLFFRPGAIRPIDRAMGWVSAADTNSNQRIDQNEVTVMKGSLLNKALVAQAVFDHKFLLPFAPEAPDFYMVPANNQVTVVWAKSATEDPNGPGDAYFSVAGNPASGALYDPNYRQFDVAGYRVWRGRSPATMEMIAQFDYKNDFISDFTGDFWNGDYNNASGAYRCAPELGITSSCPAAFAANPTPASPSWDIALSVLGPSYPGAVQVKKSGRVALANGDVLITVADTAVTGGGSGFPALQDTGVPFAYQDNQVRNGYRYYYAVTAFDINSLFSGPSSLSSPLITKAIIPRNASGQETAGSLGQPQFIRPDNSAVPSIASMPSLDRATGEFTGPMAQTDLSLGFAAFVPQVISGSGGLELFVDSIVSGDAFAATPGEYHMRVVSPAGADTLVIPFVLGTTNDFFGEPPFQFIGSFEALPVDPVQNARFGAGPNFSLFGQLTFSHGATFDQTSPGRADANAAPSRTSFNGPRWWDGTANENTPNPNAGMCAPSSGGCTVAGPITAGALTNVTALMQVQAYSTVPSTPMRVLEGVTSYLLRAADFKVFWGANGAVDSVIDETHGVPVPFSTDIYASWGILNDSSFVAATRGGNDDNKNLLTWTDVFCPALAIAHVAHTTLTGQAACPQKSGGTAAAVFMNHARLSPIAVASSAFNTPPAAQTGTGFIFYLNGKFFMMQMASLPATGTVWNARFYTGYVRTSSETVAAGYTYTARPRPPTVPGLHVRIDYEGTTFTPSVTTDASMASIHTVPDPYYVTNNAEITTNTKILNFVNVPAQAIVRIYSASGILVNVLTHNDPSGSGELTWNLRNRNNQFVASGVYFYHVEAPDGRTKVGRFTVVNYAQ